MLAFPENRYHLVTSEQHISEISNAPADVITLYAYVQDVRS